MKSWIETHLCDYIFTGWERNLASWFMEQLTEQRGLGEKFIDQKKVKGKKFTEQRSLGEKFTEQKRFKGEIYWVRKLMVKFNVQLLMHKRRTNLHF